MKDPRKISKAEITLTAEKLIQEFIHSKGWRNPQDISFDCLELYEACIYPNYEFSLVMDLDLGQYKDSKVLGKTIPSEKVIAIDRSISLASGDPRFTFTFGHECGHAIFHFKSAVKCTETSIYSAKEENLREIQANHFSANWLMPESILKYKLATCFELKNKPLSYMGPAIYTFSYFGANRKVRIDTFDAYCREIARPLCPYFGNISLHSMSVRLLALGLIKNYTSETYNPNPYHISGAIQNIFQTDSMIAV